VDTPKILVAGGAGFIGSFVVRALLEQGQKVLIFDNLSTSHKLPSADVNFVEGDLRDGSAVSALFKNNQIATVIHLANLAYAGESMLKPYDYFSVNLQGGLNLLDTAVQNGVTKFIFSSSCTVYGNPKNVPASEASTLITESIYGETKFEFERILNWYSRLHPDLQVVVFRFANASGATLDGSLGEDHLPETHLIPLLVKSALSGEPFKIFGNDYKTPDGTCIRDYIHVLDLAEAHVKALDFKPQNGFEIFNLGVGKGYSNLEVVKKVEEASGKKINFTFEPRRLGDAEAIYLDNTKARQLLKWQSQYDLDSIVRSAILWHTLHPYGFKVS